MLNHKESFEELYEYAGQLADELEEYANSLAAPKQEAPQYAPEQQEPQPEETPESYRIDVRKALAALNRKMGRNVADEIIRATTGCSRLTEVPREQLRAVMAAAEAKEAA